ncbi:hypothetical protein G9C85_10250 [Halorubellus sp. JP-L1]|uniref:DUF7533 family protein n=1 Tax=Halorubellus sp. JP-L1 TaxID=2715753 RepID=UPI00140BF0F2|nr:hypothetical protein [Halorubellus sp. JP-L1]NHN42007.1 hypothetical protein [Halorubellus sp. JP-L1]
MARSLAEQLSFATAAVIAAPIALAGLDMTLRGELTWGPVLLGVSAMILLVEKYVTTPQDLPGVALAKAAGVVAKEPEDDPESPDADSRRSQ